MPGDSDLTAAKNFSNSLPPAEIGFPASALNIISRDERLNNLRVASIALFSSGLARGKRSQIDALIVRLAVWSSDFSTSLTRSEFRLAIRRKVDTSLLTALAAL